MFQTLVNANNHCVPNTVRTSISISRRLGHSKVSTTTDKYGHIMRKADEAAANCIADVILDEPPKKQSKIS